MHSISECDTFRIDDFKQVTRNLNRRISHVKLFAMHTVIKSYNRKVVCVISVKLIVRNPRSIPLKKPTIRELQCNVHSVKRDVLLSLQSDIASGDGRAVILRFSPLSETLGIR